jgi:TonB family protein
VEIPPGTEDGTEDYDPTDSGPEAAEEPGKAEDDVTDLVEAPRESGRSETTQPKDRPAAGGQKKATAPGKGKSKIEVSGKRVRKTFGRPDGKPPKKPLSAAQIKAMLNAGARPGDHTTEVNDETLYLETVRHQLYTAWDQPTTIDIDGLTTKVDIRLGLGGALLGHSILQSSGNATMDDSVLRAIKATPRISGLPAWFVAKHARIQVVFRLTQEKR